MTNGNFGIGVSRCILTTYRENEKVLGFSPPTQEPARPGDAQALPAGHLSDTVPETGKTEGTIQ
jgi:hypothetical protein